MKRLLLAVTTIAGLAVSLPAAAQFQKPEDAVKYTLLLRESRVQLAQQGLYDKRGLKVIKRIRCHVNPGDPECQTKSEEDWK